MNKVKTEEKESGEQSFKKKQKFLQLDVREFKSKTKYTLMVGDPPYGLNVHKWDKGVGDLTTILKENNLENIIWYCEWKQAEKEEKLLKKYYRYVQINKWEKTNRKKLDSFGKKAYENFITATNSQEINEKLKKRKIWKEPLNEMMWRNNKIVNKTQKSEELEEKLINIMNKDKGKVLCLYGGMGTTAKVCKKLNIACLTVEINKEAIEIAKERLEKHEVKQTEEKKIRIDNSERSKLKDKEIRKIMKKEDRFVEKDYGNSIFVGSGDTITFPWKSEIRPKKRLERENFVKEEDMETVQGNIDEELKMGVLTECKEEELLHIVPVGCVEKKAEESYIKNEGIIEKSRKVREILDFTYLNSFIKKLKVELPNYKDLAGFLSKGYEFFCKMDMSKAYFRIALDKSVQKYCGIEFKKKFYYYKKMPFGLGIAPYAYQNFIMRVLGKVKHVISYLDDVLIGGKDREECEVNTKMAINKLETNRVVINKDKSILKPVEEIIYLGYIINKNGIYNKKDRIERIGNMIKKVEQEGKVEKRKLASVIGEIQFATTTSKEEDSMKELYSKLGNMEGKEKFKKIKIKGEEINKLRGIDLKNRISKYDQYTMANIKDKDWRIVTDASPWGIGIFDIKNNKPYYLKLPRILQEKKRGASDKEMLGCLISHLITGGQAKILCDNQGTIRAILNKGYVKNRDFRNIMIDEGVTDVEWVSNKDNRIKIADAISRDVEGAEILYEREEYTKLTNKGNIQVIGCKMNREGNGIEVDINGKIKNIKLENMIKRESFGNEINKAEVARKTRTFDLKKEMKAITAGNNSGDGKIGDY